MLSRRRRMLRAFLVLVLVLAGSVYAGLWLRQGPAPGAGSEPAVPGFSSSRFFSFERFGLWWGEVSPEARAYTLDTGRYSNIEPADYMGAQECGKCHKEKFQSWSRHAHRWMNARASADHIRGDFAGQNAIAYLGGKGRFWRQGDQFFMAAERGLVKRVFKINRTIGSRYFQYYVGQQLSGPEPADDPRYRVDHVLPFGYWLAKRQWVPTVHINDERSEDSDNSLNNPYESFLFSDYDRRCSQCHTTLAMGDWLLRSPDVAGHYSPYRFTMALSDYLERNRSTPLAQAPARAGNREVDDLLRQLVENSLPAPILHLGIECETCHNGGREHVADPEHVPPHFFPTSPLIQARLPQENPHGRTHDNVNWICARCHNGGRPLFPGGIATWNSVEYSDAMRGGCYSQLKCIDCHDPHKATGATWPHSEEHDDGLCLRCHQVYREARIRQQHTHHAPGREGDRCMNCHMPRINEGLDQLVRTHTICSPTRTATIEENGPNACNLCHLDRSINWTLGYLGDWYGRRYDEGLIERHYGRVWLRHPFQAMRLVAASTYGRQKRAEDLPALLPILDDQFLLNRQFGQMAVEAVCGRSLENWSYRFTLSPEERAAVLPRVRAALLGPGN